MKKFFLVVFSLFIILSPNLVKADTLPGFNINISTFTNLNNNFNYSKTYQQFLDELINLESNYYNISIYHSTDNIIVYLVPTAYNTFVIRNMVANATNYFKLYFATSQSIKKYIFTTSSTSSDYSSFLNCYQNNSSCVSSTITLGKDDTTYYQSATAYSTTNNYNNEYSNQSFWYYSSVPLEYEINYNTYDSFFSSYSINGTLISNGSSILTYHELYQNTNYDSLESATNFTNILVGNIVNLHDFRLNLQFDYDNETMISNMNPYFYVYGRKNNSTYYSYERLDSCSAINNHKLDKTLSNGHAIFNYFSQGISCGNTDLTQYDNFYLQVQTISSSAGNYNISNIQYNVSSGNFTIDNSNYSIYESFINLPYDFSFLVTSSEVNSNVRFTSSSSSVVGCGINLFNKKISQICYSPYVIGTTTNEGYMIYNLQQYNQNTSNVSIYIDDDSIISFGTNGSNQNSSFDYYDNTGTIQTSIINNKLALTSESDDYDILDYINIYNDYIYSLRDKINNFALQVQNFYDTLPGFFQSFLYVAMLTLGVYIVYLAIRKW